MLALFAASPARAESAATFYSDYQSYSDQGKKLLDRLDPITGDVNLPEGVTLHLKEGFYFVDGEDARTILTEAWGNPPGAAASALGMIFPGTVSPIGDTWGIEVYPDPIGYVDDKDAATINYGELLASMQDDTREGNPERVKAGYDPITLVGWAQPPQYDGENKRLYWAKELKFGDAPENTLNYDIRFLNRRGVLVMSYIASMKQLEEVNASLPKVLDTVEFGQGFRYADFVPGTDTVAAVGVGGLIAGKVLAKTGLLVVLLALAKKFGIVLFLPLVWVWRKIRGTA